MQGCGAEIGAPEEVVLAPALLELSEMLRDVIIVRSDNIHRRVEVRDDNENYEMRLRHSTRA